MNLKLDLFDTEMAEIMQYAQLCRTVANKSADSEFFLLNRLAEKLAYQFQALNIAKWELAQIALSARFFKTRV